MFGVGGAGFPLFLYPGRMEGPRVFGRWKKELSRGGRDVSTPSTDMAMGKDELRWEPVALEITGSSGMVNADRQVLVNFKMEVGRVHAMIRTDGSHLLPALKLLALTNCDPVEMRV